MQRARIDKRQKGTIGRRERFKDNRHDVYQERQKWPEPTRCKTCHAVYVGGRWTWDRAPADAHEVICPACRRIADNYPAGIIALKGPFVESHREEIRRLIRHTEEVEKREHALERVMALEEATETIHMTTTGIHLARRIGGAVEAAYGGKLVVQYPEDSPFARIYWER
jgi:NMD protein affecting ribosome stability and mRNA decay